MKLISIIIPFYNEEQNIPLLYSTLEKVCANLAERYDFEFIFVNDGSRDRSAPEVEKLINIDNRVKQIEFTRNFGKEIATTAGLNYTGGDAAIMIDADLQHPPETMPEFISEWEKGTKVVVGVRRNGNGKGAVGHLLSNFFYRLINLIGETHLMPSSTDFRLVDRQVIDEFNRLTEKSRITRGLIDWLGFPTAYVYFKAEERKYGQAKYDVGKLFHLALSAFVSHSLLPLKFSGYLGVLMTVVSGALGFFIFIEKYLLGDPFNYHFSGPAILAVINLFLIGIVLSSLGVIGLYVGSIQNESLGRPMYIVKNRKPL